MKQFIKNNRPFAQTERNDFAQKYLSDGCVEVPVIYKGNLIKPLWNGNDFVETEKNEEINNYFLKQKEDFETKLYIKRIDDAKFIWAGLSARFRIKKQQGILDDASENIILAELKPVLDIVVPFGQWMTGRNLLIEIGDSVIGVELYQELLTTFDNYILENYSPIEIEKSINSKLKK